MSRRIKFLIGYAVVSTPYFLWFYSFVNSYAPKNSESSFQMFDKLFYSDLWSVFNLITGIAIILYLFFELYAIRMSMVVLMFILRVVVGLILLFVLPKEISVFIVFWIAGTILDVDLLMWLIKQRKKKLKKGE